MKIQEHRDIQAVVIGAGPAGLACVKELIKLKKKVLLIHINESNELKMGGNAINWHSQCAIYEEEEFLVNCNWIKNKNNYNLCLGGSGGINLSYYKFGDKNPMYGKKHKLETIEKIKYTKNYGK